MIGAAPDASSSGFDDLVAFGVLASAAEPFDPMEKAFHALAQQGGLPAASNRRPGKSLSLAAGPSRHDPCLAGARRGGRRMSSRRKAPRKPSPIFAVWAPRSGRRWRRPWTKWRRRACAFSASRARPSPGPIFRTSQRDFAFEFLGLAGLADPLRKSVPAGRRLVPHGRHPRHHDHRRLSGDGPRHRAAGRRSTAKT